MATKHKGRKTTPRPVNKKKKVEKKIEKKASVVSAPKCTSNDPFAKLFGSVARVRLLRLFLFSPKKTFSPTEACDRSRISENEARYELKLLVDAGFLRQSGGSRPRYTINNTFPFMPSLQQMLLLTPLRGNDIPARMKNVGTVKLIVLAGIFAGNFDEGLDILVVGEKFDERRLRTAIKMLEAALGTELKFASLATEDFTYRLTVSDRFVRDVFDYPHRIIFDKLDIGLK